MKVSRTLQEETSLQAEPGSASPLAPRASDPEPSDSQGARLHVLLDVITTVLRLLEAGVIIGLGLGLAQLLADRLGASADDYLRPTLLGSVFYAVLAEMIGAYDADVRFTLRRAGGRVLTAWLATGLFMVTLAFLFQVSADYSRAWALLWLIGGAVGLYLVRTAGTMWMRVLKQRGLFDQRVAIFGAGAQGDRLANYIASNDKLTIDIIGFFDDRTDHRVQARGNDVPILGDMRALIDYIRAGRIDQVIIALPWSAESRLQSVVGQLAMTPVRIRLAPDLASFAFAQRPLVLLGDLPVMTLFERPISGFDQILKGLEDRILGLLLLTLSAPILLLAAIAIKLDSPGPIFFRQDREGFNNRHFRIWKLRTMYTEHSQHDHIAQAQRGDPRVTRVGAFLRRTSIDELPQLFNVMTGDMSLVGPRPHAPSTRAGDKLFSDVVSTYAARHKVKPGITGWAQVCGWRGETDTEDKLIKRLEHDLYYIENWSPFFDIYILLRTFATVLSHRFAY